MANNTTTTVMDLLLAAEAQAINGLLYNCKTSATLSRIWLPQLVVHSTIEQEGGKILFLENNSLPALRSCGEIFSVKIIRRQRDLRNGYARNFFHRRHSRISLQTNR